MTAGALAAAALAAVGAGAVNALAGGGTLISFPVLTALGVPSVSANATNTVALCPGYVGGTLALRAEIDELHEPLRRRLVVAAVGGFCGALALLLTSDATFRAIVPYLILLSCLLLAVQDRLRRWVTRHRPTGELATPELVGIFLAALYGGYFGAGLGIMLIAVLGLFTAVPINQVNALKQPLAAAINLAAAAFLDLLGQGRVGLRRRDGAGQPDRRRPRRPLVGRDRRPQAARRRHRHRRRRSPSSTSCAERRRP